MFLVRVMCYASANVLGLSVFFSALGCLVRLDEVVPYVCSNPLTATAAVLCWAFALWLLHRLNLYFMHRRD